MASAVAWPGDPAGRAASVVATAEKRAKGGKKWLAWRERREKGPSEREMVAFWFV